MTNYIEYDLEDGATILIEISDTETTGVLKASRGNGEVAKTKAKKTFADAIKDIRLQAKYLFDEVEELHVDEAQIKFGINTVGELGNLAVGKIGMGVNYEVTLKWSKPQKKSLESSG